MGPPTKGWPQGHLRGSPKGHHPKATLGPPPWVILGPPDNGWPPAWPWGKPWATPPRASLGATLAVPPWGWPVGASQGHPNLGGPVSPLARATPGLNITSSQELLSYVVSPTMTRLTSQVYVPVHTNTGYVCANERLHPTKTAKSVC